MESGSFERALASRAEQAPGGILWAAVVPLAMRILATSDDDWGRWEPLAKAEASAGASRGRERRSRYRALRRGRTVVAATDREADPDAPPAPAGYRAGLIRP